MGMWDDIQNDIDLRASRNQIGASTATLQGLTNEARAISADYRNPNSEFNKNMMRGFLGMAKRLGPGTNTLMSAARGPGGLSMGSSGVMTNELLKQYDQKARAQAGDMFLNQFSANQGIGAQYFGQGMQGAGNVLQGQMNMYEMQMRRQMQEDQQQNFLGGLLGFAGQAFMPGFSSTIGNWMKTW